MLFLTGNYNISETSISMPLNVHYQNSQYLAVPQAKSNKNTVIHHSQRLSNVQPLQIRDSNLNSNNQNSKRSSSKNPLQSPRNHCFQKIGLRAMLKKAKEVSPGQTYLPPKSPRPHSRNSTKLQRNEMRKYSGSSQGLGIELGGILKQQVKKPDRCKTSQGETKYKKQEKDIFNQTNEKMNDELGSLSQIIFFGDANQESDIKLVLLPQRISNGGQLQCRQLLNQLQNA